jgi:hypothetical protein
MRDSVKPSYFLIAVSTQENLELCIKHGLAGFPSGESGVWTYSEIVEGDFISFLYGAKAHNLYKVAKREAIANAENLPPWKILEFRTSGKRYSFPFRLKLDPVRVFSESLVRAEFSYVAENLLLRGGYSKSHFQADQTTLQSVSQMGKLAEAPVVQLDLPDHKTFVPRFTKGKGFLNPPEVMRFKEPILQSAIRQHLMLEDNLKKLLLALEMSQVVAVDLEILGEKALPQGHVDILMKQRVPLGSALQIPIEVKTKGAKEKDLYQLRAYMDELAGECATGILLAADFGKKVLAKAADIGVQLVRYSLNADLKMTPTFEEICQGLSLTVTPK